MLVNRSNLDSLRVAFSAAYQMGVAGMATSQYAQVATVVPAAVKEVKYGWLGKIPSVREWIGPRQVQNLMQHDYSIVEKPWELTISVDRDDIETDNIGIYNPLFTEMGASTGAKWDQLVFDLIKAGFTTTGYDGQNFFDTDHPVIDADGVTVNSVANTDGGGGTPWYLLDLSRPLKPVILQKRKDFEFVAKDRLDDDNVFFNKEFIYGADARANAGLGFWQQAWGSKQTLDATNYNTARTALAEMKGDHGRPLGLRGTHLLVPPSLESAARKLLNSEFASGGETNEWKGTAELIVSPWLA